MPVLGEGWKGFINLLDKCIISIHFHAPSLKVSQLKLSACDNYCSNQLYALILLYFGFIGYGMTVTVVFTSVNMGSFLDTPAARGEESVSYGTEDGSAGEKEATAREEAAPLGGRSCSAAGPLEGGKARLCTPAFC